MLRRIDSVLAPTKRRVLETHAEVKDRLDNPDQLLRQQSGYAFYNTSRYDFESLLGDAPHLAQNLHNYIAGFSDNMREVIERFDFRNTITKLDEAGLLYLVLERFKNIDLHPDAVSNLEMGYIFEELIRKFNEASNENPGEHFTPREVVRLMVNLLLAHDADTLGQAGVISTIYDPCCGTGGMLTVAKDRILEMNPAANVYIYGQEVNPETFAVAKSDLYIKSSDGRDAENIAYGSTLSNDQHKGSQFDYILANPPYGKEWKMDRAAVEDEANRGYAGRFGAGTPRISDGQMLFLQHMLSKMRPVADGGSRIAIVMNGSPLFTGDAGSGESEIRRWILENDWLDAIIALPEQLFYNTGISTYVWVLTNRKPHDRRGTVQLIGASSFYVPMRKSLGDKRREIADEQIADWAAHLPSLETTLADAHLDDVLELDELWSFVLKKTNQRWVWVALCRRTRQIVAYFIGDRSEASCRHLWERIPQAYKRCHSFSDGWTAYQIIFAADRHQSVGKDSGETNHIERWYNTLRQRLARFVRKTLSFSKSDRFHECVFRLFVHHYNQTCISQ
ncbi:MAG: IS1 family transposase [Anaerolineaceae bacterium]|nr:IS1 family transposase [Anaerolineaceae bacterium]